jgi:hypothetical protein
MFSSAELPLYAGIAALSAAVSSAAGVMSQQSKIKGLGGELETSRAALTVSEQQLGDQVHDLEEKLFIMDREFEGETDKFKKQYDLRMRQDVEKATEKMKVDYGYKLEIRVEEEKSKMLQDKLFNTSYLTGSRQTELVEARLQQSQAMIANQKMEKALAESTLELKTLKEAASKQNWWKYK